MKTKTALIIPLLCSCLNTTLQPAFPIGRGDHLDRDRELPSETFPSDSSDAPPTQPRDPVMYLCGVEYPDSSAASIVLLKGGRRILSLPLGKGVSSDADSHFLINGTLYTVSTDPWSETVVCRNGNPIFSFPEREYISDLFSFNGQVWTLGIRRSGEGFALRCEGRKVFERESGWARGLHTDGDGFYFTYADSVASERMFFLVDRTKAIGLSPRYGGTLLAARMIDSELWAIEGGSDWCEIYSGKDHNTIHLQPGVRLVGASLYKDALSRPLAILNLCDTDMVPRDMIVPYGSGGVLTGANAGYYYMDPFTRVSMYFNPTRILITRWADHLYLDNSIFHGSRCVTGFGGKLYIAASRPTKEKPFVWSEGHITEIPLEGYLTGIEIFPDRQSSQLSVLTPSGPTLINTFSVSSGSNSSTFSGHSIIQRLPESR